MIGEGQLYVVLALSAYLCWSLSNIFDKIVVDDQVVDPVSITFFEILLSSFVFLLIPVAGLTLPSLKITLLMLLTGALFVLFVLPYFAALKREEVSRVVPLWRFYPIFTLIIAHVTVGERLSFYHYCAFALLIAGGFLISVKKIKGILRLTPAFWFMILATFLTAIHDVLLKYIYELWGQQFTEVVLHVYLWVKIGSVGAVLCFLTIPRFRQQLYSVVSQLSATKKIFAFTSVFLSQIAMFLFFWAIARGSVSIISALGGFESLFTLIFAILFTLKWRTYFGEEIRPKILLIKFSAILLIFVGLIFLYL